MGIVGESWCRAFWGTDRRRVAATGRSRAVPPIASSELTGEYGGSVTTARGSVQVCQVQLRPGPCCQVSKTVGCRRLLELLNGFAIDDSGLRPERSSAVTCSARAVIERARGTVGLATPLVSPTRTWAMRSPRRSRRPNRSRLRSRTARPTGITVAMNMARSCGMSSWARSERLGADGPHRCGTRCHLVVDPRVGGRAARRSSPMPSIQTSLAIAMPFCVGQTLPSRRSPGTRA